MSRAAIIKGDVHAVRIVPDGIWHLTRVKDPLAPLLCGFTARLSTRWFNERASLPLSSRCAKCWRALRERIAKGGE